MNVEIGTEAPIFLFWEHLFRNFGILSVQCGHIMIKNQMKVYFKRRRDDKYSKFQVMDLLYS
jgi:hypothetical protein